MAAAWMRRRPAAGSVELAEAGPPASHPPAGPPARVAAGPGPLAARTEGSIMMTRPPLTTSYWPADTGAPVLDTTIGGVLRAAAERAPDQPALIAGDPRPDRRRQWTYGQLLAEAERAAHALARFAPGDPVAVWSGNCPEWVLLEFAAGLAGLTLVPVNPAYQAEELAYALGHCGARGVFLAAEHRGRPLPPVLAGIRDRLPELREVIPLEEWDAFCAAAVRGGELPAVDTGAPALILYTSGTTGRPKAAVLTHQGLTNNARLAAQAIGMRAGEALVNPMPLFHVAGGGLFTLGLAQTLGTHVLMPHFDPGLALELTETYRGACVGGVPTMLTACGTRSAVARPRLPSWCGRSRRPSGSRS